MRCALLATVLVVGCAHPLAYLPGVDCEVVPGEYVPGTTTDSSLENAISADLRAMGEPILWKSEMHPERALRLFIEPFGHPPVVIRLQEHRNAWVVTAATYPGDACRSYNQNEEGLFPEEHVSAPVDKAVWETTERLLWESGFWSQPGLEPPQRPGEDSEIVRLDGNIYFLEIRNSRGYHFISRESGAPGTTDIGFARLCSHLVSLSPLHLTIPEAYCPEFVLADEFIGVAFGHVQLSGHLFNREERAILG